MGQQDAAIADMTIMDLGEEGPKCDNCNGGRFEWSGDLCMETEVTCLGCGRRSRMRRHFVVTDLPGLALRMSTPVAKPI